MKIYIPFTDMDVWKIIFFVKVFTFNYIIGVFKDIQGPIQSKVNDNDIRRIKYSGELDDIQLSVLSSRKLYWIVSTHVSEMCCPTFHPTNNYSTCWMKYCTLLNYTGLRHILQKVWTFNKYEKILFYDIWWAFITINHFIQDFR